MRLVSAIADLVAFGYRVAVRTRQIGLARAAGSLAFTTLLGLVPLATVALEFVARFPVFHRWLDALETFLLRHMLPETAYAVVHTHIREFTEKAAGLTGISILFIVVTAAMLIGTVEREINALWGVTRARPLVRRLFIYAAGTTVGPVLVGASISVSTWLVTQSLDAVPLHGTLSPIVVPLLPLVFSTLALAFLYEIVPARHVPWRHAFAAGFLAALAFEGAKQGFALLPDARPDVRTRLRRARRAARVPDLDLRLLADRAGGRSGHRDADAAARCRAAPRDERAAILTRAACGEVRSECGMRRGRRRFAPRPR